MKENGGGNLVGVILFTIILITQICWTFVLCFWQTSIIFQRRENRDEKRDLDAMKASIVRPKADQTESVRT